MVIQTICNIAHAWINTYHFTEAKKCVEFAFKHWGTKNIPDLYALRAKINLHLADSTLLNLGDSLNDSNLAIEYAKKSKIKFTAVQMAFYEKLHYQILERMQEVISEKVNFYTFILDRSY